MKLAWHTVLAQVNRLWVALGHLLDQRLARYSCWTCFFRRL